MKKQKNIVGWREWAALPQLKVQSIKAKIDTGARTSSLHAFDLETFRRRGKEYVRFKIHPVQRNTSKTVVAEAEVIEYRQVKSSTGHVSERPVILTEIELLGERWEIELTLANRDEMGFRMLLGREGIRNRLLVDASKSYYGGKPIRRVAKKFSAIKLKRGSKRH